MNDENVSMSETVEKVSSKIGRRCKEEKENPLNRFGFSALTEREKKDKAIFLNSEILASKAAAATGKRTKQRSSVAPRGHNNKKLSVDKKRKSKRKSSHENEEDENEDEEEKDISLRKSSRTRANSEVAYVEADSDDEYAQKAFILPESDSRGKTVKSNGKKEVKEVKKTGMKSSKKSVSEPSDNDEDSGKESEKSHCGDFSDSDIDTNNSDSEGNEESNDNEIEYKIQHILTRQSMTPSEWQVVCAPMNTR